MDEQVRIARLLNKFASEDEAAQGARVERQRASDELQAFGDLLEDESRWINNRIQSSKRRIQVQEQLKGEDGRRHFIALVHYNGQPTATALTFELQLGARLRIFVRQEDGIQIAVVEDGRFGRDQIKDLFFKLLERPIPVDQFDAVKYPDTWVDDDA